MLNLALLTTRSTIIALYTTMTWIHQKWTILPFSYLEIFQQNDFIDIGTDIVSKSEINLNCTRKVTFFNTISVDIAENRLQLDIASMHI